MSMPWQVYYLSIAFIPSKNSFPYDFTPAGLGKERKRVLGSAAHAQLSHRHFWAPSNHEGNQAVELLKALSASWCHNFQDP